MNNTSRKLLATIDRNEALDPAIAGDVAHGMKEWALSRGASGIGRSFGKS